MAETVEKLSIIPGKCIEVHNGPAWSYVRGDNASLGRIMVRVGTEGGGIWQMERDGDGPMYKFWAVVGPGFTRESIFALFPARVIPAVVGI